MMPYCLHEFSFLGGGGGWCAINSSFYGACTNEMLRAREIELK